MINHRPLVFSLITAVIVLAVLSLFGNSSVAPQLEPSEIHAPSGNTNIGLIENPTSVHPLTLQEKYFAVR